MAGEGNAGAVTAEAVSPNLAETIHQVQEEKTGAASGNWRDRLPAEVKGEKFWDTFKTEQDAFKAHAELVKYRGANPKIPGPDATPEEKEAFYKRIGRPEKPDLYQIKRPEKMPEGLTYNEELEKGFLADAHAAGLTNDQAQKILDHWNTKVAPMLVQGIVAPEKVEAALKEAWGTDFDKQSAARDRTVRTYFSQEMADALDMLPLEMQLVVNKGLARMGEKLSEDSSIDLGHRGGTEPTKADLERKKAEIYSDKAYTDRAHPMHKNLVAQMVDLNRQLAEMK
jgi:hypothetical protein